MCFSPFVLELKSRTLVAGAQGVSDSALGNLASWLPPYHSQPSQVSPHTLLEKPGGFQTTVGKAFRHELGSSLTVMYGY